MNLRFIPFGAWPADRPRTKLRKRPPSKWTAAQAMRALGAEIERIQGKDASVEVVLTADQLRRDGLFYKGKAPKDPGVILRFTDKAGNVIAMPSDHYTTVDGNVWALYKTLEALRAVDRHGCAVSGEQYKGWARLPPGGGFAAAPPAMTRDQALEVVARFSSQTESGASHAIDLMREEPSFVQSAIRLARNRHHPDKGGDVYAYQELEEAIRVIEAGEPTT
jgi:hypothetical protein